MNFNLRKILTISNNQSNDKRRIKNVDRKVRSVLSEGSQCSTGMSSAVLRTNLVRIEAV